MERVAMSAAHILLAIALGALWRRCKGSTNGGPLASWALASWFGWRIMG